MGGRSMLGYGTLRQASHRQASIAQAGRQQFPIHPQNQPECSSPEKMNMPRAVVRISFICPVTFVASGELMSVHLRGSGRQRETEGGRWHDWQGRMPLPPWHSSS